MEFNLIFQCLFMSWKNSCLCKHQINLLHESHNALVPYPTMHHFVTEICTCVHISVTKWSVVGHLSNALWDLWDGSIFGGHFHSLVYKSEVSSVDLSNGKPSWIWQFMQRHFLLFNYKGHFLSSNSVAKGLFWGCAHPYKKIFNVPLPGARSYSMRKFLKVKFYKSIWWLSHFKRTDHIPQG